MLPSAAPENSVRGMLVFSMLHSQCKAVHQSQGGMFDLGRTKQKVEVELVEDEIVVVDARVDVWNRVRESMV